MRCLITGAMGQDAYYLGKLLTEQGHEVFGMAHQQKVASVPFGVLVRGDLSDPVSIYKVIQDIKPDELYNMGAFSHAGYSFDQPVKTMAINGVGPVYVYDAVRRFAPNCHIYQASTSELFGTLDGPANEETPFKPENPYGVAKLYAHQMASLYRRMGVWVTCGILFNHTSPRQSTEFLLPKLILTAQIIVGRQHKDYSKTRLPYTYANKERLAITRDIGWAEEYCQTIIQMLRLPEPVDMVIATGVTCSVEQMAQRIFEKYGIYDWRELLHKQEALSKIRPVEVTCLEADTSKAQRMLGWNPRYTWPNIITELIAVSQKEWHGHS